MSVGLAKMSNAERKEYTCFGLYLQEKKRGKVGKSERLINPILG